MRVWHSPWSWLKLMVAAESVAGNTLTGMFTRLIFRNPFQVGRAAITHLLSVETQRATRPAQNCTRVHCPGTHGRTSTNFQSRPTRRATDITSPLLPCESPPLTCHAP